MRRVQPGGLAPFQRLEDAALGVDGEPLVEPEVVGARVGDQVSRPGVRQLVGDDVDERAVAGDHRGRDEGEPRVLHAAVGEAGRHHQDVVALPLVRAEQLLGARRASAPPRANSCAAASARRARPRRRSGRRARAAPDRPPRRRADRAESAAASRRRPPPGRPAARARAARGHQRAQPRRHGEARRAHGDADARRVLQRHHASGRGWAAPARRGTAAPPRVCDGSSHCSARGGRRGARSGCACLRSLRQLDAQPLAEDRLGGARARAARAASASDCTASMRSPRVSRSRGPDPGEWKRNTTSPSIWRRSKSTSSAKSMLRVRG